MVIYIYIYIRSLWLLLQDTRSLEAETTEVDSVTFLEATMLVGHAPFVGIVDGSVPGPFSSLKYCSGFGLLHRAFSLSAYLCIRTLPS